MSDLVKFESQQTMSSREIADLVESNHSDVRRSIERLAERGVIQLPPLAEVKNHLGQTVKEYQIGKRDSYVIVAQLSPEFTARLVDRWQELEKGVMPKTLPDALRAYANELEQKELLKLQLEQSEVRTNALEVTLDIAELHASVKKMEARYGRSFSWQRLKDYSLAHGYDMPKVFDQNYERGVNSYHDDVWMAVYNMTTRSKVVSSADAENEISNAP